ncbi:MAG: UbiA prenyltransferase family protein [Nitrospirae bacterium]|nr:UbiA prenyltransferase family protein [Nitrospirota bacterium]
MRPLPASPPPRLSEWFVPRWGPSRFRTAIGLLFLPYTGMVLSYTIIGGMLAPSIVWERVAALLVIYFLGLGIAAHALDALGSRGLKPWGEAFSRRQLWIAAAVSLLMAYAIVGYYSVRSVPWLAAIAVIEGFFVFSYNLEWWNGRFHTDAWFAFSWGALPVLAGYVMQTNALSVATLIVAGAMSALSIVEITASRAYKTLKRRGTTCRAPTDENDTKTLIVRYERILKSVSLGVIALDLGLTLFRFMHA